MAGYRTLVNQQPDFRGSDPATNNSATIRARIA
jgi:hypothetical protein